MTVDDLRRTLEHVPGFWRVFITMPDDEVEPLCITGDKTHHILRLCKNTEDAGSTERVLESFGLMPNDSETLAEHQQPKVTSHHGIPEVPGETDEEKGGPMDASP